MYAIIVIASRGEIYDKLIMNWINIISYVNKNYSHVKIYLIFGKNSNTDIVDDISDNILITEYDETVYPGIIQKTMFTLKELTKNNFDFIIRTNLSSYVSIKNIDKYISNLDDDIKNKLVLSYPRYIDRKWPFTNKELLNEINNFNEKFNKKLFRCPSGAFFMISKDVAIDMIEIYNKKYKNSDIISKVNDDDIVGLLLKEYEYTNAVRINISTQPKLDESFKNSINNCLNRKFHYHFRCKNNNNREHDIDILDFIFKIDIGTIKVDEKYS